MTFGRTSNTRPPRVTAAATRGGFYLSPELAGRCAVRPTLQPLYEGAEILRLILKEPRAQVDVKPKADLAVLVMETGTPPYVDFPGGLDHIHRAVVDAIERLRPFALRITSGEASPGK